MDPFKGFQNHANRRRPKKAFKDLKEKKARGAFTLEGSNLKIESKPLPEQQRQAIEDKITEQNTRSRNKMVLVVGGVTIAVLLTLAFAINNWYDAREQKKLAKERQLLEAEQQKEARKLQQLERDYADLVDDAHQYYDRGKWHSAIYQYEQALVVHPENRELQYDRIQALIAWCAEDSTQCEKCETALKEAAPNLEANMGKEARQLLDSIYAAR